MNGFLRGPRALAVKKEFAPEGCRYRFLPRQRCDRRLPRESGRSRHWECPHWHPHRNGFNHTRREDSLSLSPEFSCACIVRPKCTVVVPSMGAPFARLLMVVLGGVTSV